MLDTMSQDDLDSLLKDHDLSGTPEDTKTLADGEVLAPNCFSIRLNGATLGFKNAYKVFARIRELAQNVDQHLILRLGECPYLSSFALGEISQMATKRHKTGLRMFIVEANDTMKGLLEITGLEQVLTVCDTVEDALESLRRG